MSYCPTWKVGGENRRREDVLLAPRGIPLLTECEMPLREVLNGGWRGRVLSTAVWWVPGLGGTRAAVAHQGGPLVNVAGVA